MDAADRTDEMPDDERRDEAETAEHRDEDEEATPGAEEPSGQTRAGSNVPNAGRDASQDRNE